MKKANDVKLSMTYHDAHALGYLLHCLDVTIMPGDTQDVVVRVDSTCVLSACEWVALGRLRTRLVADIDRAKKIPNEAYGNE